ATLSFDEAVCPFAAIAFSAAIDAAPPATPSDSFKNCRRLFDFILNLQPRPIRKTMNWKAASLATVRSGFRAQSSSLSVLLTLAPGGELRACLGCEAPGPPPLLSRCQAANV